MKCDHNKLIAHHSLCQSSEPGCETSGTGRFLFAGASLQCPQSVAFYWHRSAGMDYSQAPRQVSCTDRAIIKWY